MIYARECWVVEIRPGEFWVEAPGAAGIVVTSDPARTSTLAEGDNVIRPETLAVFPRARVLKVRVTVVEVDPDSRASWMTRRGLGAGRCAAPSNHGLVELRAERADAGGDEG